VEALGNILLLAAEEEEGGGNFLVSPNVGLMIWTLLAFGITLFVLNKVAFPRIAEALDKRRKAIEDSIEHAEQAKREADDLLATARRESEELRTETDEYVDSRLANFEVTLHKTLEAVTRGRERLQGRTTFHALGSPEPEDDTGERAAGQPAAQREAAPGSQRSPALQPDAPGPAAPAPGETRLNPSGA